MDKTHEARHKLRTLLTEAVELLNRDDLSAATLKDQHYEIGRAFRPAIEELRAHEEPLPHWTVKVDFSDVG